MAPLTCWVVGSGPGSPSCGLSSSSWLNYLSYLVGSGQHSINEKAEAERTVRPSLWNLYNITSAIFCWSNQVTRPAQIQGDKETELIFWWEELQKIFDHKYSIPSEILMNKLTSLWLSVNHFTSLEFSFTTNKIQYKFKLYARSISDLSMYTSKILCKVTFSETN